MLSTMEIYRNNSATKILYEEVSVRINRGEKSRTRVDVKSALEKSTLIKIITGERFFPDEGQVNFPKNLKMGYLDQYVNVDENPKPFADFLRSQPFAADFEKEAKLLHYMVNMLKTLDDELPEEAGELQNQLDQVPSIKWTH